MDRFDLIETIIMDLKGTTGRNFQNKVGVIFRNYYKEKNKCFEMPNPSGGDDKNDGWVVDDAIFYQIYSPENESLKITFSSSIKKKFEDDLDGLLDLIINESKWKGCIKKFIFIVNTIDQDLPKDSDLFFNGIVKELCKKYGIEFDFKVCNVDYIRDILRDINEITILKSILSELHISQNAKFKAEAIDVLTMYELIKKLSNNIIDQSVKSQNGNYKRISSGNKISINNLNDKKERIENIISKLDVVDHTISLLNQEVEDITKFEDVKGLIINYYEEISKNESGSHIYDSLVNKIKKDTQEQFSNTSIEYLIVYIFDKCDIFEKER